MHPGFLSINILRIFTLSNLGVSLLDHLHIFIGGFAFIPKILMDTLLYLVNYRIQNKWIFAKSAENQEG